jgi:hypothetical protein
MGIDYTGCEALLHALQYVKRGRATTLGRQEIHIPSSTVEFFLQKYQCVSKPYSGFCEPFLQDLGFETVDSIDNSPFEGATILHNMNQPIPYIKPYDFILDGGTIEHIFNTPQVCENIINLLEVGGIYLSITPNNNFSGHGIYQFSPEFYLSAFSEEYGMKVMELYLAKVGTGIEEWINVNSYQGGRNTSSFRTNDEVYIIAIIKKVSEQRKSLIHQSPNQYSYELETLTTACFPMFTNPSSTTRE